MGYYIEPKPTSETNKYIAIKKEYNGINTFPPKNLTEIPKDMSLVCIIDNTFFKAAAYIYSNRELEDFKQPDGRKKEWLLIPKKQLRETYPKFPNLEE